MTKSKFEDVIARSGQLIYTHVGDSMYPFIQPDDLLVISAVKEPLHRYDVPLYKRDTGQYVLHRIIGIKDGAYVMCGDNRCCPEYGIADRHIIGVLTGVIRDGENIAVSADDLPLWKSNMTCRKLIMNMRRWIHHDK